MVRRAPRSAGGEGGGAPVGGAVLVLVASAHLGCVSQAALVSAPRLAGAERAVRAEEVRLRCEGERSRPACRFEGRYRLDPARPPAAAAGVLHAGATAIQIDADVPTEPASADVRRELLAEARDRARDPAAAAWRPERPPALVAVTFDPQRPARELRVRATLVPPADEPWRLHAAAPLVRHQATSALFGLRACTFDEGGCRFNVDYLTARGQDRSADHELDLRLSAPGDWEVRSELSGAGPAARPSPGAQERMLTSLRTGEAPFAPGGPFLGLGALLSEETTFKGRLGWELFAPQWLAYALAAEADAGGRTALALTVEIVSPMLLVLPSVGVGLGLPIALTPELASGARLQLSAQYPYVGVVATMDLLAGTPELVSKSLYLQVSL